MRNRFSSVLLEGLWLLCKVLARTPQWLQAPFIAFVTSFRLLFARRERDILYTNIAKVWGLPKHSSFARRFARQVLTSQMQVFFDTLVCYLRPEQLRVEGLEELRQVLAVAEAEGQGQILISAHIGSWEFIGRYATLVGAQPLYALAKPPSSAILGALAERLRRRLGCQVLWTGRDKGLLRSMTEILQQNATLGLVMDQKPRGRQGPEVNFFGQVTPFVPGPASMALHQRCPVVAVFCLRTGFRRFRFISSVLTLGNSPANDLHSLTQLFAREIERVIRLYPEQWCWNYKRWVF